MPGELLKISDLSYRYQGAEEPALSEVSCSIKQGEFICLTGSSGCGKSTLLLAVMGLLHGGTLQGSIEFSKPTLPDRGAQAAGIVFQNADAQMLCSTVAEEVAFGPENLCVPPDEIAVRVREALRAVGLDGEQARSAERFSAGQKQRLAIASVLSMRPSLLLLDEPTSQLDVEGKQELFAVLSALKAKGHTVIMAEHDPRPFAPLIDRYLTLEQGRAADSSALPDPERFIPTAAVLPPAAALHGGSAAIEVQGLRFSYPETGEVLSEVNLRVPRGERVHLFGRNGAGKSSFLRCLAGLVRPERGTVLLAGMRNPGPERLPGKVGVLFQNPARQLFAESVRDEVAFTLQRLGCRGEETARTVAEALDFCGIAHLAERAPLTLSFGEQHRVALAAVVAPRPDLLLLDEPFSGLDYRQRLALLYILGRMPVRYGTTVLIASHDQLPDSRWADRSFLLRGGTIAETTA